jgi:hypothetical protein
MSHREEAPRQQLTAPDSSETPRTDASLSDTQIAHLKEGILGRGGWTPFYEDMIGLLCEQASRLSQCREALEKERKDAGRYQWLRRNVAQTNLGMMLAAVDAKAVSKLKEANTGLAIDQAIDAALPSAPKE